MPGDTFVFLGPTMPVERAREILPSARYLPPVACGDVLRCRPLRPAQLVVIDGVFENTGAVWHKELLLALQDGAQVIGCSSMGALRAAELEAFGMVGMGTIFERYRDRAYTDDDEVAVMHATGPQDWRVATIPLVNVRASAERAVDAGALTDDEARAVVETCRGVFYQERTFDAIRAALASAVPCADRFSAFLDGGGYVDQKRLDAEATLAAVAAGTAPAPRSEPVQVSRNSHVRRIETEVMCRPFRSREDWLPALEHAALDARLLGQPYLLLRTCAELLMVADTVARLREVEAGDDDLAAARNVPATERMTVADRIAFAARAGRIFARLRAGTSADARPGDD